MEMLTGLLIVVGSLVFYLFLTRSADFWRARDVPYVPPIPVFGNLKPLILLRKSPGPFLGDIYKSRFALGRRFVGIFLFGCEPALLVRDPEIVKRILVQDFDHFRNRNVDVNPSSDPIGAKNLFVTRDYKWKYLRTKLSPTFTSGKLKQMFLLIKDVTSELIKVIAENADRPGERPAPVGCKELIGRFTTDVINSCAFGIRSNSLGDPNSQFRYFGRKIFHSGVKRSIETRSFFFMHWLAKTFRFVFFEKDSSKFMADVFGEILTEREKSMVNRNDFVDVLIKLKKDLGQTDITEKEIQGMDEETVISQAALFYTAGFETTSETIMFTLYELSLQQDIQDTLRKEILETVQRNGGINYEDLFQMKYLDMVVSETLRKYPPMPFIDRVCTKDYKIPDTEVTIEEGTPVFISLYNGLHYDSSYFPDPEKYDPERFSEEGKCKIQPYSYLPFGEGPHTCLGMRFGLMNAKTALSLILSNFKVETCEKTNIPVEISERTLVLSPKNEIYLVFSPL